MKKTLLFDGDVIAHTIASSCEKRSIRVVHPASGTTKEFNTRTEFWGRDKKKSGGYLATINENRKVKFLPEDFVIEDVQTPEPLENCLHSVKVYMNSVKERTGVLDYQVLIGYGECHRHQILMPEGRRYKENRDDKLRAIMVDDIKEYFIKHHNAEIVNDVETDDKLAMLSWEGYSKYKEDSPYIVVTRDKDQGGVDGWWFNTDWMKRPIFVDGLGELFYDEGGKLRGIGRKWKYFQLLVGDTSDGYKPTKIPNTNLEYGEASAYKLLNPLQTDRECLQAVANLYREWMPSPVTYKAWNGEMETDNWISWLNKHFQFVHMMRWDGDIVDVPKLLDNMGCLRRDEK